MEYILFTVDLIYNAINILHMMLPHYFVSFIALFIHSAGLYPPT